MSDHLVFQVCCKLVSRQPNIRWEQESQPNILQGACTEGHQFKSSCSFFRTYANAWSTIAITWATDIDHFVLHNLHKFWKNEHCDLCARARALYSESRFCWQGQGIKTNHKLPWFRVDRIVFFSIAVIQHPSPQTR